MIRATAVFNPASKRCTQLVLGASANFEIGYGRPCFRRVYGGRPHCGEQGARPRLSKAAADKQEELSKLKGAAFDKAYIDNEVAYHTTVNGAVETTLIPSATNGELKSLLETCLKVFQGHQQHAEQVDAELK